MRRSRKWSLLVGGIAEGLAGAAYGAEPTTQDLLDKINALQAQVNTLQAQGAASAQPSVTSATTTPSDAQIAGATRRSPGRRSMCWRKPMHMIRFWTPARE